MLKGLSVVRNFLRPKSEPLRSQQRFRSEAHNVLTEKVNKISLRSDDDKKSQTLVGIASYSY